MVALLWKAPRDEFDQSQSHHHSSANNENLQIIVEPATRKRTKEEKTQHELELAFKRRLNRDLKERQLLLHKASLLCLFGRSYNYNRLLNDSSLMQAALKLLPGAKAYPRETGTELKYFQSFVTWFKTVVKLSSHDLYADDKKVGKTWASIKEQLLEQIKKKEARCKQDMIFILIALIRGMGLQCRLVVNMQPLPLKPAQQDLLTIKLKADDVKEVKKHVKQNRQQEKSTKPEQPTTTSSNSNKKPKAKNKEEHNSSKENSSFDKAKEPNEKKKQETQKTKQQAKDKEKSKITLSQKLSKNEVAAENVEKAQNIKKTVRNQKENETDQQKKSSSSNKKQPNLSKLKRPMNQDDTAAEKPKKPKNTTSENEAVAMTLAGDSGIQSETSLKDNSVNGDTEDKDVPTQQPPEIVIETLNVEQQKRGKSATKTVKPTVCPTLHYNTRSRSRSVSPRALIETEFLQTQAFKEKFSPEPKATKDAKKSTPKAGTSKTNSKAKISPAFLRNDAKNTKATTRVLRSRQNSNTTTTAQNKLNTIPQLDGADDDIEMQSTKKTQQNSKKALKVKKQQKSKISDDEDESDADFEPSPPKQPKRAPVLPKNVVKLRKDQRVLSTDDENNDAGSPSKSKMKKAQAADMWLEVWSDVENEWICIDLFKGKLHSVESIRKSASSNLAYVFAFQNDLSLKDVTARYCPHWSTTVRKNRVDRAWLEIAISPYLGRRTERDIREDHEMRRIHEEKPLPTAISDFKDHPLYVLERHLLKFQAIYPPDPPTIGFTKTKEPIYSRDCVHLLHSREIWLKQARTVKLGEQPYKIVKARPKWDRLTQSVIKDQPLEIFGFWQTEEYEPPTAENGIVPRNAYGNVELFKACMLPKKTVHLRLPGLNRICKKLNIDCANAVIGFDFHQGACHPTFDGFVVCEEYADQVTAAWYQDQEDQERKEQEKYEARVYGNWKKLIKGLLIRERIKKKYNF